MIWQGLGALAKAFDIYLKSQVSCGEEVHNHMMRSTFYNDSNLEGSQENDQKVIAGHAGKG